MATSSLPWDTGDLVNQFLAEAGIQEANEFNENDDICPRLSRAQGKVLRFIAARYPKALYQAPIAMTPDAERKTFSYGDDAQGNPILPIGYVQIAPTLRAFSGDRAFVGWQEDRDFLDEGVRIRIPSDRTYGGTLYARFVPTPPTLQLTPDVVNPILNPADARALIVIQAVMDWAGEGNQRPDIKDAMKEKWANEFPAWMLTFRKRFRNGGALYDPARWYFAAPDLGTSGT